MSKSQDDYDFGEHNKEVYAHFGLAFYMANCLEHGIAIALMYADFLTKAKQQLTETGREKFDRKRYEADFDAFFDNQFAQTMGNLLKRLGNVATLTDETKGQIVEAKKRRDYLSHHFFRDHAANFMTRQGRDKMIAELEEDRELFHLVDVDLYKATKAVRDRLGVRDEWLKAQVEKTAQRITRGESLDD